MSAVFMSSFKKYWLGVSKVLWENLSNRFLPIRTGFCIVDFIKSLPHFYGEEIVQREKKLSRLQVFALKEYLSK